MRTMIFWMEGPLAHLGPWWTESRQVFLDIHIPACLFLDEHEILHLQTVPLLWSLYLYCSRVQIISFLFPNFSDLLHAGVRACSVACVAQMHLSNVTCKVELLAETTRTWQNMFFSFSQSVISTTICVW